MRKLVRCFWGFAFILLVGCSTVTKEPLPTFEVQTSSERAIAALASEAVNRGYIVADETPHTLTLQKIQDASEILSGRNLKVFFQISVAGDNPATITGRVYASFGVGLGGQRELDITHRERERDMLLTLVKGAIERLR